MRVIAGSLRSRRLVAPEGAGTRPTSDRLRETLFNVLAPRISGSRFVDLYAGTGAVGIEAISRGAAHVFFAENARPALHALLANLRNLGITAGMSVEQGGAASLLERLRKLARPVDLVFLDPPYDAAQEYIATLDLLGSERGLRVLRGGALVIAEHSSKRMLPARVGHLHHTRLIRQGDAALSLYAIPAPAEGPADEPGSHLPGAAPTADPE